MSKNELAAIAGNFANCRIAVIGDVMLDVYQWGRVDRISPEAPVPVVSISRRTSSPGGAGNVMSNIAALGGKVFAFGAVGKDAAGAEIRKKLGERGISDRFIVDIDRRTTEKQRIVSGNQQLLRVDVEDTGRIENSVAGKIAAPLMQMIAAGELDAVIFDDYAKGMLSAELVSEIASAAADAGIITALDPKPGSFLPVRGLTVMKPNRQEAFAMANVTPEYTCSDPADDRALALVAETLMQEWQPEQLIISLASQGMALFESNGKMQIIPTRAREVFDVSGAGDTVIAAYTMALVSGASPAQAAKTANAAAGVVVGKLGTVAISYQELIAELEQIR